MNLKPGRYSCEVTAPSNGWFGEAGDKQTPFIRIPLVITEGEHEGEEVVYQAWVSDSAYSRTIKNLREIFEWDGDMVQLAKETSTGHFVGLPCSIVCEEEEYKGKKRVVIKWLNGPNGDKMMDVNRALQLARRLTGAPEEGMPEGSTAFSKPAPKPKEPDLEPDLGDDFERDKDGNIPF